jgi:CDP-diacylglycerol--glycerol-3-phosphate 3-phosphatidyltransferase
MFYLIQGLTIFRVFSGPALLVLISVFNSYSLALFIFFLAAITDYFDGYFARKFNLESEFGSIIDPIADKILILFMILAIQINTNSIYFGLLGGFILAREFWVAALRDYNSRKGLSGLTTVTFAAKLKTTFQLLAMLLYLIYFKTNNHLISFIADLTFFIAFLMTIKSGLDYTLRSFEASNNST